VTAIPAPHARLRAAAHGAELGAPGPRSWARAPWGRRLGHGVNPLRQLVDSILEFADVVLQPRDAICFMAHAEQRARASPYSERPVLALLRSLDLETGRMMAAAETSALSTGP
jgi:hypothetical protein